MTPVDIWGMSILTICTLWFLYWIPKAVKALHDF